MDDEPIPWESRTKEEKDLAREQMKKWRMYTEAEWQAKNMLRGLSLKGSALTWKVKSKWQE